MPGEATRFCSAPVPLVLMATELVVGMRPERAKPSQSLSTPPPGLELGARLGWAPVPLVLMATELVAGRSPARAKSRPSSQSSPPAEAARLRIVLLLITIPMPGTGLLLSSVGITGAAGGTDEGASAARPDSVTVMTWPAVAAGAGAIGAGDARDVDTSGERRIETEHGAPLAGCEVFERQLPADLHRRPRLRRCLDLWPSDVRTPHIDRIAAEGCSSPRCGRTARCARPRARRLLTGRYADRVGVPGVIRTKPADSWGYFDPDVPTLADVLGDAGYHTALIGKWHLGLESPNTPNERGFAHFHGFLGDMMDSYTTHRRHGNNYMRLNAEVIEPQGHATDLFSDWAADYLRGRAKSADQPFFLFSPTTRRIFPSSRPRNGWQKVKQRAPEMDEKRARNVAFVEHLDAGIGRVLAALDDSGLAENTVVVFTADNGGSLPHAQNNDPWRGGKQDHYDGGLRVPFMVRWPARSRPAPLRLRGLGVRPVSHLRGTRRGKARRRTSTPSASCPCSRAARSPEPRDLYFVRREGGFTYGGKATRRSSAATGNSCKTIRSARSSCTTSRKTRRKHGTSRRATGKNSRNSPWPSAVTFNAPQQPPRWLRAAIWWCSPPVRKMR
jgi:hypothetical protein